MQKAWPNALFAFDRMVERAAPGKPGGTARGYEYLSCSDRENATPQGREQTPHCESPHDETGG